MMTTVTKNGNSRGLFAVLACLLSAGGASAQIELRFENPGVQDRYAPATATASTANFNGLTAGSSYSTLALSPGAGGPNGTLTPSSPTATNWVQPADQYGGAGGTGNYLLSGNVAGFNVPLTQTLNLSSQASYFGVWIPSMDAFNQIRFLNNGTLIGIFNASSLLGVGSPLSPGLYNPETGNGHYGNPNPNFQGGNPLEPFVYLNFYAENTSSQFDTIEFSQVGDNGGFEIDNLAVFSAILTDTDRTGTIVGFIPVPEPTAILGLAVFTLIAARRVHSVFRVGLSAVTDGGEPA